MIPRRRLLWQLYPSFLLLLLFSLLAVSWYTSRSLRQDILDRTRADLKIQARLLERQVLNHVKTGDAAGLDRVCKDAAAHLPIRVTAVFPDGRVACDSREIPDRMDNHRHRPEIAAAFEGRVGTSTRFSGTLRQRMMYVAVPLGEGGDIPVVLRTSIPVNDVDGEIRAIRYRLAVGGLLVALLASAVCMLLARRVSRPLEDLERGAETIAAGDLSYRFQRPRTAELASLAESMNRMTVQLESRLNAVVRQRNELDAVLSSMKEGLVAVDREERVIRANQAAEEMFGTAAASMTGRSIQEVMRNRDLHRLVTATLDDGQGRQNDILFYQSGEQIFDTHATALLDTAGSRIGALVVLNDVTQLRRLESMRRDFAANVSHEIKTPLTAIKGFVETLRHSTVDPEESTRFLGIIDKHVNRLTDIIDDLMQLSRIEQENERREIRRQPEGVKDVLRSSIGLCQQKADAKNIRLHLDCPDDLTVPMDAALMERAVVNLIDNAVKYSTDESTVDLRVENVDEGIRIHCRDEGIGIASKHLPRLFERFYRVDKARSRKLGGTGLGLAIVKHIVQAHDGDVTVESVPGRGSTFTIFLPRV